MNRLLTGCGLAALCLSSFTATADAAFIRRGKMKQKQTIGYRVVATTSGDATDSVTSVKLDEETDLDLTVSRLDFSADVDPDDFARNEDESLSVPVSLAADSFFGLSDSAQALSLTPCTATPCEWTAVTLSEDVRLKARMVGGDGDALLELESVVIVRLGDDARETIAAGTDLLSGFSLRTDNDSGEISLDLDQVRNKWKTTVDEDPEGDTVVLGLTAYDADGEAVDSLSDTVSLSADGVSDGIGQIKLKERRDGSYRITTLTSDDDGAEGTLATRVTDGDGETVFSVEESDPSGVERHFRWTGEEAQFEDNSLVADDGAFNVAIYAWSGSGTAPLAVAETGDFQVGEDGSATIWIEDTDPTDGIEVGLFQLEYDPDLEEYSWFVAVSGEDASQVDRIELYVDSLGTARPINDTPTLGLEREWRQWVQTFASDTTIDADNPVTLSVELSDADQQSIDNVSAEGGTGTAYKAFGFGKGTKATTSQASTKPQLL